MSDLTFLFSATRDPELLKRTFAFSLSSEVKNQDLAAFFSGLANNPLSKRDQWAFFQENYEEVARRFKGNFSFGSLVKISFQSLTSEEDAKVCSLTHLVTLNCTNGIDLISQAVETFFAKHDTSAYSQPLSQGLDAVRSKAAWLKRDTEGKKLYDFPLSNILTCFSSSGKMFTIGLRTTDTSSELTDASYNSFVSLSNTSLSPWYSLCNFSTLMTSKILL